MRSNSSTAWASANSGNTCSACDGTLNHSRRRCVAVAPNSVAVSTTFTPLLCAHSTTGPLKVARLPRLK